MSLKALADRDLTYENKDAYIISHYRYRCFASY